MKEPRCARLSQLSATTGVLGNRALGQQTPNFAIVPRGRRLGIVRVEVAGLVAADVLPRR
jgi:hypothetical protein